MNKIAIITDSTSDLNRKFVEANGIIQVPLHVTIEGDPKSYLDGVDITSDKVYELVEKYGHTPKTGARNVAEFVEDFKPLIEEGYDIIYAGIGSGLSSTYNNAVIASKEFPEGRIEIIDSQNLSTGTGLLINKMVTYRNEGLDVHQIAEKIREHVPLVSAKFCINRLDYLYKGGRCSGMTKIFAHMLKIHPVAKVIDNKLSVYKKPKGDYINAVNVQIEEFKRDLKHKNIELDKIYVTDSGCMDGHEDEFIIKELSKYVDKDIIEHTRAGCVVTSHCGPKTIGILYILKRKVDY